MNIALPGATHQARVLLRRCGYAEIRSRRTGETSYIRRLRGTPFPRFHLYVQSESAQALTLTLHLDAKQPSYEGTSAHAGEYDGEVVEVEATRIRSALGRAA